NTGTFALQDGSVGNVSGDVNFTNNGKISVKGNNNVLKGDKVHIYSSAFNIEGTDVTKDFLTIDAKIDGNGAGKFNFKDVSVTLSDTFYNNNNTLAALEFTNSGIVTGNGKSNVDYTLSNGAGINVPGTFTGHDFKFQDGSILYTKIGSALWDRLVVTGNIEFTGNTKVILLNYGNHEVQVNADKIIEAAGKITVGGSDLAQNMVSTVANNSATITGGTSQVVVESAKSNGVDQLLINEINVTNKTVSLNVTGDKTTTSPLNPDIPPGTYTGQGFKFQDGSILYTKIGSDQWDKLVAEGNIEFTGNTKVILLNYGNHEAQVNADNIIETTAGKITVGDSDLNQSMVSTIDNNNATITGGTSQVVVESAKSGNVDQLQINEINVTDKTVSVKITGNKATTPPPVNPPDNPSYPDNPIFGTSNLEVLGDVLLAMGPGNEIYQAIAGYAGNDQDKLMAALSQLDPVILSVATTQSLDAVQKFITAGHRRSFERLGTIYQSDFSGQFVGQVEAVGATVLGHAPLSGQQNSCSLWFQALGGWQNQSTTGVEGYSADTFGFALGADQQITFDTLLGVSFGGHFSNAKSKSGNNSAKTDTILFSVYGGQRIDNLFFNASAGYAGGCLKSQRSTSLLGGWANSKRNAESYFGNLEMAYRFGNKLSYLTPFISYDFIGYEEDAFTETGNIALNIAKRKANAYFQTLGARLGCQAKHSGILLNSELTLGWLHDYGSGSLYTTGQFVSGGPAFTVVGVSRNKNRGVLGVKIDTELSKWTNVFLRYDSEFATHYNAQYLTGGINITF
ncbi:MAG: autotransporter domain-containing protein, partial [Planctomycetaceae bacterium]|nr:autotransporter domain-containing protein [Planctomycetaceae bacterium]